MYTKEKISNLNYSIVTSSRVMLKALCAAISSAFGRERCKLNHYLKSLCEK